MGVQVVEEAYEEPVQASDTEGALRRLKLVMGAGQFDEEEVARAAAPRVVVKRALPDKEILATVTALSSVLTVRLMLLLAIIGAFALAWRVTDKTTWLGVIVLAVYTLMTVSPLVMLSRRN